MLAAPTKAKRKAAASPAAAPQRRTGPDLTPAGESLAFQLFTRTPAGHAGNEDEAAASAGVPGGTGAEDAADGRSPRDDSAGTAPFGTVIDDQSPLGPEQMHRTAFIDALSAEIERVADEELGKVGQSARDCPYLDHWLRYYRNREAWQIERAIQHYAHPERTDLPGLSQAVLARVRTAVHAWIRSGGRDVQAPEGLAWNGMNDGVPPAAVPGEAIRRKSIDGTGSRTPPANDPAAVRAQLPIGQPLESGVRTEMERGFGRTLGHVRLHTGSHAARLAGTFSARAFTVGSDIAFGAGQYRPDSLTGKALLAHELAHVVQQAGADSPSIPAPAPIEPAGSASERQADAAAAHVVQSLLSPRRAGGNPAVTIPFPLAPTRLRLQRCGDSSSPQPAPPPPSPQDQMRTVLREVLADKTVNPAEWQRLHERSRALRINEPAFSDLAAEPATGGLRDDPARIAAVIAIRTGPALDAVRASYTGTFGEGDTLSPSVFPDLVRGALADASLDFNELDAMRAITLRQHDDTDLRQALGAANLDPSAIDALLRVFDVGFQAWGSLAADPVALPIRWNPNPQGKLITPSDLRVVLIRALTGDGAWDNVEFRTIRSLLQPLGRDTARQLLVTAGFERFTADQLAKQFTATESDYRQRMPQEIRFRRDGRNFVLVTPMFPEVPAAGASPGVALRHVGTAMDLGDYTFSSGVTAKADRQIVEIRGRQVPMIRPNREDDFGMRFAALISANDGLAPVPPHHIALIQRIVLDPGERQDAAADAGRDGTVTLYWASAAGGREGQRIMVHETGHLVSYRADSTSTDFWTRWNKAAQDDNAAVSVYGTTNRWEDFAEAYLMFVANRSAARTQFPHRSAILDPLVNPATPAPPTPSGRP